MKPRSTDLRVVTLGQLGDEAVRADCLRRSLDLGARGVRSTEGDVFADGAPEQEAFLRNDPELSANRGLRHLAQVGAVDRDAPVARVVEAGEQLRDRGLPRARVADERDRGAGRDVEVEVVQDVGEIGVSEPDVLEADVPLDLRELTCVLRVDDVRPLVEDRGDAVECCRRGEERVVELRELLHGVEEVREIEHEGDEGSDLHLPFDDGPATDTEHDRGRDRRDDVDGGEVHAVEDDRLVFDSR